MYMNSPEQLIKEIKQIADQYQAEVTTKRKRWPKSIQGRIRELFVLQVSIDEISTRIPIARATLFKWRRDWGFKGQRHPKPKQGQFIPMRIETSTDNIQKVSRLDKSPDVKSSLTVRLEAMGITISGFSLEEMPGVIKTLRGML